MKATFRGGVHPAHGSKAQTQGLATRSFVSDTVRIIMNMNMSMSMNMRAIPTSGFLLQGRRSRQKALRRR